MRTRFINLRIPANGNETIESELLVEDDKIRSVHPAGDVESETEGTVDLGGALVLPGVIDAHVHFDDPGFTHREDFATGTAAAAAGGVTTIVDMPCTSLPPVTSLAALRNKLEVITPKAHVDYMLWGGVSDNALAEPQWQQNLQEIVEEGVAAIKIYFLSGMETFRDVSRQQAREVLQQTKSLGIPVGVHAEDRGMVRKLQADLQAAGDNSLEAYAASRPAGAEIAAVARLRELSHETGAAIHIVHVGSAGVVDLVSAAKREGLPMTAETCPHFLAFTAQDLLDQGSVLKTAPVVKTESDRDRLWQALASRELDFVATDHAAGAWPEEKETGSAWTDYGGVPGVELSLPYLYSEGVGQGHITLERMTELLAGAPARFLGIDHLKGRLAPGLDADFVVFEEQEEWTVSAQNLHNKNCYTPLEGQRLVGRVREVYLRGKRIYRRRQDGDEKFAGPGVGQWVKRKRP